MNGPGRVRRRRFFLLLPLLLASIAIPAGRGDAADDDVTAAQVAEGLKTIQDIAADVALAAGTDKEKAQKISEGMEPVWSKIEDKLRGNDKDAYITFEDSFEILAAAAKAGDAKKAGGAAEKVAAAVKAYVSKYPADAAPAPAAAAAAAGDATLARTGGTASALTALAGMACGLGGLAVMAGARRRLSPIG